MAGPAPSALDGNQVLQHAFIDATGQLRVSATLNPEGTSEIIISHTNDSIRLGDGTNLVTTTTVTSDVGLDVYLLNSDIDIRDLDASQDNIAIHDTDGHELEIEADGSINVNIAKSLGIPTYTYNEITSVVASTPTTIVSYTAPIGFTTYIQRIDVSGTNIAEYEVKVNGTNIDKKYTYFGNSLSEEFIFSSYSTEGYLLAVGDLLTVVVTHIRGSVGDFNSKIQTVEI